jgi:hypothetical protein
MGVAEGATVLVCIDEEERQEDLLTVSDATLTSMYDQLLKPYLRHLYHFVCCVFGDVLCQNS